MPPSLSRRDFLNRSAQGGAVAAVGDFAFLRSLPPLSAAHTQVTPGMVRFSPEIEPLVRLLEETPRNRLIEIVADRVRGGTTYQELLSALMLAGVRSIRPRPVGFQFHAVLAVNSAHQAALAATDRDRWLPLFWGIDLFKNSQATHLRTTDWVMPAINEGRLPPPTQARRRFIEAMDNWDLEGADLAISQFVRTAGASEVIELFWRYGARDFRDIGHKAIFAANAWRTLNTIGWRHAEPVMRSLAFALLDHEGTNPAQRDADQDRPWRQNLQRVTRVRRDWQRGEVVAQASTDLLATLRSGNPADACEAVVTQLNRRIDPSCLWDGVFLMAGELLMRQPGIVGVHCVTSANALHFAYQTSENPETRLLMLMQASAFMAMFLGAMRSRGNVGNQRLDTLETIAPTANGAGAVEEIFADVSRDRMTAARKTIAVLQGDSTQARALIAAARRLVFSRGTDSHDYKFSSASLEDFYHATPAWRNRFLATGMFYFRGSGGQDSALYRRIRAALGNA